MNYPDFYRYIAVFAYYEEGISITFPDLPGCVSFGKDEEDGMKHAKEVLMLHLWGMEQDKDEIPEPSSLRSIEVQKDEVLTMVEVFMPPFREKQNSKFIKKTLSIPNWLNTEAENKGVNFSKVLQNALIEYLGVAQ